MARIAVVTGGIGGLGTAMCKALAEQGRQVISTYRKVNYDKAKAWQWARQKEGYDIAIYLVYVAHFESCKRMVAQAESDLGSIDILVNNAGITRDRSMKKMGRDDWDAVINVDLSGVFNMTNQVFAGMLERSWGRIVNISSINGQKGQFGQANYSAAHGEIVLYKFII